VSTTHFEPPVQSILIADADARIRDHYRDRLFPGGDVVEASDGRDALVKALMRTPRLVLTELRLPLMDGVALCEILRRDQVTADVPIMVVTSESNPLEVQRALKAGADVVLPKHAGLEVLRSELERLVERGRHARAASMESRRNARQLFERSANLMAARNRLSKSLQRLLTTNPPDSPPLLECPRCYQRLRYVASYLGGVSVKHPEQWDLFECDRCGRFEYRQRTRQLRSVQY
jgi:CheY-like chemotaxis protein